MSKEQGGAAFPLPLVVETRSDGGDTLPDCPKGMTMRQWYKGMALTGFCAHKDHGHDEEWIKFAAEQVEKFADAMIAKDKEAEK